MAGFRTGEDLFPVRLARRGLPPPFPQNPAGDIVTNIARLKPTMSPVAIEQGDRAVALSMPKPAA